MTLLCARSLPGGRGARLVSTGARHQARVYDGAPPAEPSRAEPCLNAKGPSLGDYKSTTTRGRGAQHVVSPPAVHLVPAESRIRLKTRITPFAMKFYAAVAVAALAGKTVEDYFIGAEKRDKTVEDYFIGAEKRDKTVEDYFIGAE
ncbi:uncharacterized protein MAM_02443 [Metarhizium album ARSEF 1941]|uniref:Uncharacterized protein n=1 Tax=Metarhizium album (strain ARSEF 1941) TaxID=1081103 RepID=A0A0B2X2T0_METAS|nr:uncharacterized protein MAM_02443 [Metarhizium album ARSEF 1941]KHN99590.1 hypothetical protein MAM_02443 [Metarhizium album ARSEF 1941]